MKKRFYEDGLRFECTGCGDCCRFSEAAVFISDDEVTAMADYLELSESEFRNIYIDREKSPQQLFNPSDDCIFLKDLKCQVYDVRPSQCRTFPFWGEIIKSKYRWKYIKTQCEGVDQGRLYSYEEIRSIARNRQDTGPGQFKGSDDPAE